MSLNQLTVSGGKLPGPEYHDLPAHISAATIRVQELEAELQKAMTRASIDSAVRSWNQLSSPMEKLRTAADFQDALKRPSKRSDAVRALAAILERATNEKATADFRALLSTLVAAPVGVTTLVDFLLHAQRSSDALTAGCASVVLSQIMLSEKQAEQMARQLSKQAITTGSDPVVRYLIDLASRLVPTSQPRVKPVR